MLAFGHDGAVLRVKPGSGEVERVAPPGTFPIARVWEAEPSPDGSRALAVNLDADAAEVQLVDTTSWKRVGEAAPWNERLGNFDLSPDGTQFAAVDDGAITIVDATTGERQATIPLPVPAAEVQIIYLPDSAHLLVAGSEGSTWTVGPRWQSGRPERAASPGATSPARSGRSTTHSVPTKPPAASGPPSADTGLDAKRRAVRTTPLVRWP